MPDNDDLWVEPRAPYLRYSSDRVLAGQPEEPLDRKGDKIDASIVLGRTSTSAYMLGIKPGSPAKKNRENLLKALSNSVRSITFPPGDYFVDNSGPSYVVIHDFGGQLKMEPRARFVSTRTRPTYSKGGSSDETPHRVSVYYGPTPVGRGDVTQRGGAGRRRRGYF
jgi:hypothetical protein